jgi:hypothetical protein
MTVRELTTGLMTVRAAGEGDPEGVGHIAGRRDRVDSGGAESSASAVAPRRVVTRDVWKRSRYGPGQSCFDSLI